MPATRTRTKRRLGRFLRELREDAGKTLADAAALLRTSEGTVSRYESGLNRPQWATTDALLVFYGATDERRARANVLWEDASVPTPPVRLPAGAPAVFKELLRAEREAVTVRLIGPLVVPGLLQTADYARAVHALAQRSRNPQANVEDFVAARLDRQRLLDPPNSLRLHALLDEATLHREVGGPDVIHGQCQHLLAVGERENITVQIIPFKAGGYGSMSGSITMLDFEDPDDSPAAYLEHPAGGVWVDNGDDVRHLSVMFDGVREVALSVADSAEFIRAKAGSS